MKMGEVGRTVNIGVIGLGGRGSAQTSLLASMPDVCIKMVCDKYEDRVQDMLTQLKKEVSYEIKGTCAASDIFALEDIEAVIIMTDWETHIDLAIQAMRSGKHVGMEVGGASSVAECWKLVQTSEETGKGCMLLENCCYNREELALLNMVRRGLFGELIHCQGGYEHDLRDEIGKGDIYRHYRQHNFTYRNGELYPTHELGPIMKYLDINYGNRMTTLVSMASKSVGLHEWMQENRPENEELKNRHFNEGDIVTTMIRCAGGQTILLTHDCTLPRPYSRGGRVQGTKGIWMEDNRSIHIDKLTPDLPGEDWSHSWESDKKYMEAYESDIWKEYLDFGLRGGHGGMDYLVFRGFFEALQQGTALPIDVYDTASLMVITALSEMSIAKGSMPIDIPDFTNGKWMLRKDAAVGIYKLGK